MVKKINKNVQELKFSVIDGDHVLRPENEISTEAQNLFFDELEERQKKFINEYSNLTDDEKIKRANSLANLFVAVLMNNDQVSFKILLGSGEKLMNNEELKNIKNDFIVAKRKKDVGEYKSFLLLDLLPYSNRRADAIIISNSYQLELYDFSEGVVAEKLKKYKGNMDGLSKSEQKQFERKTKQQERIVSFNGKIKMDSDSVKDIIMDDKKVNFKYYCQKPYLFDFNLAYSEFLKNNRVKTYIPSSVCFLIKNKEYSESDLFRFPLKGLIDHPYYSVGGKNIEQDFIDDIYENNTCIVLSKYYFFYFFEKFTSFKIIFKKKVEKNQVKININGKSKGIELSDLRTGNSLPLFYSLLFKHVFMNMSLKSWCEYISALCNQTFKDKNFNKKSFYHKEIKKTFFFFDV